MDLTAREPEAQVARVWVIAEVLAVHLEPMVKLSFIID